MIFARDSRAPSMMLAWFSSSERMKSSLPRIAPTVAGVGRKAALEDHAGLHVLEARNLFFQVHVDAHGAGDGAHRARAHAERPRRGHRRLNQPWVVGQAKVVVAGQVDHLAAVVVAHRRLLVVEDAQLEVGSLGAQFVERCGQMGKLGAGRGLDHGVHLKQSRITRIRPGSRDRRPAFISDLRSRGGDCRICGNSTSFSPPMRPKNRPGMASVRPRRIQ